MSSVNRAVPNEVIESEERIQFFCRRMEYAIAHHDFEGARFYWKEDSNERAKLEQLRTKLTAVKQENQ